MSEKRKTISNIVGKTGRKSFRSTFVPENRLAVVTTQVVIVLAAWYIAASYFPEDLMPYPYETLLITYELIVQGIAIPETIATLQRIFWAFLGVVIVGTTIGVLMGLNNYAEKALTPYVMVSLTTPGVIWAIFTLLVFGFGSTTAILITIFAATPYTTIHIWKGVENIQTDLIKMGRAFNLSRIGILRHIVLPNIAPQLFGAARFGLGLSYKVMILAELFAVGNGIGYRLIQSYEGYRFQQAWAWGVIFLAIIIVIEFGIFRRLEERMFEYRVESDLTMGAAE